MRKYTSILIIALITISCTNSLTEEEIAIKNDLTKVNLKGNVKSINEIAFKGEEKFGEIERGERIEVDTDLSNFWHSYEVNVSFNEDGFEVKGSDLNLE